MRNLNEKNNVINHFFDKILFFELSSKKEFHGCRDLEIFVGGLKIQFFNSVHSHSMNGVLYTEEHI